MSALDASANAGAEPVRAGFELDAVALTRWCEDHVEGFAGPLEIAQFKGGQSQPDLSADHAARPLRAAPQGRRARR